MGCRVALLTMRADAVALMPCNPSIGGPAKGHLVREIDALGGQMGTAIDESFLQIRMLNTSKGAAVQAPRAQADKAAYQAAMRSALDAEPRLELVEATAVGLTTYTRQGVGGVSGVSPNCPPTAYTRQGITSITGVTLADGHEVRGRVVVLTTGTALRGRLVAGERVVPGSRYGEPPALGISEQLDALGFRLRRLKTGTPPRVHVRSVDFGGAARHDGAGTPLWFSGWSAERVRRGDWDGQPRFGSPRTARGEWPNPVPTGWRPQLPCYLVHTTAATHDVIRANLGRSPMFDGTIEGVGPRYCPSIEDKVVRFVDKQSHGLFLEPEGWETNEVYVQGASTSLPEDVQLALLRSIPQLRNAEVIRYGYAVEYDAVASDDVGPTLESRHVDGLFVAGQIVGTSGYEEAAAQGLLAGINAALRVRGVGDQGLGVGDTGAPKNDQPTTVDVRTETVTVLRALENGDPVVLPRSLAYAGVMVSDLTSQELPEPYRLLTARAETRLLLRADTAELRLAPIGARLGLISGERLAAIERRRDEAAAALRRLAGTVLVPRPELNAALAAAPEITAPTRAIDYLCRPGASLDAVAIASNGAPGQADGLPSDPDTRALVETEARYAGYVERERAQAARAHRLEAIRLGEDASEAVGLRREAREALRRYRPLTAGEAARLAGVTPADVAVLMIAARRREGSAGRG
jgi:tRNA uridine 5-carboxymethylaminomethyl modification enzyme